jgi:hypothetical protein
MPASVAFPIPNVPSILGYHLYAQGILFDPGAISGPTFGLAGAVRLGFAP